MLAEKIRDFSQLFGYCEIDPSDEKSGWLEEARLSNVYERITNKQMKCVSISSKSDIWPAFKRLFGERKTIVGESYGLGL
jgi:uncharacterized sporulation protein YeaH/YhbH (DUF444 family)